eukprot:7703615-Pyramimonas_sp.AAC.1
MGPCHSSRQALPWHGLRPLARAPGDSPAGRDLCRAPGAQARSPSAPRQDRLPGPRRVFGVRQGALRAREER